MAVTITANGAVGLNMPNVILVVGKCNRKL